MAVNRGSESLTFGGVFEFVIPAATTFICVLLTQLPYGQPLPFPVTPLFAFVPFFYWALFRPSLLPPALVFLIGLYQDLLSAGPLGLWTLTYLVFYGFFVEQRHMHVGQSAKSLWFTFAFGMGIACLVQWAVTCLFYFQLLSPAPILIQAFVTVLIYPLFVTLFSFVNKFISNS